MYIPLSSELSMSDSNNCNVKHVVSSIQQVKHILLVPYNDSHSEHDSSDNNQQGKESGKKM